MYIKNHYILEFSRETESIGYGYILLAPIYITGCHAYGDQEAP